MADYPSITDKGECIFCEIVERRIKTPGLFWEDEDYLAFLSLWPNTEGFSVVIPKKHFGSDVLKMPDEEISKLVIAAKKVSIILKKYFKDVGRVGLIMEGLGINHAHIKLFPMHNTEYLKDDEWKQVHCHYDKFFDKYEGYLSSNDGPKADEKKIKELADQLKNIR